MLMNIIVIIYTNDNVWKKNHPVCSPAGTNHPVYQMRADQFPRRLYWKQIHKGNQQIIYR